jgi:hypothetical protein
MALIPVTSLPVSMLLTVICNGTFCTTTFVRKKAREYARHTSGYVVPSGHVTSCDLLWAWGAETHQALKSVKDSANTFDWSTKWTRTLPSFDIFSWVIYRDHPPNPNIKVVFRDSWRHISGGAKGSRPLRMGYWKWRHRKRSWPEITSHEVTWPEGTT